MRFHIGITRRGAALALNVAGATSAFVAGYYFAMSEMEQQYENLIEKEIAEAKLFYQKFYKADDYADPETAAESLGVDVDTEVAIKKAVDAAREYQRGKPKEGPVDYTQFASEADPGVSNIFDTAASTEEWDQELEEKSRTDDKPFIISHDEYVEAHNDQMSLTYFEEDDVLIDDQDRPVDDIEKFIGEDNLTKFGHGSGDNNVVYIRNPNTGLDVEIIRSKGSYAHEVMGVDNGELRHSHSPRVRKFRGEDD